MDFSTITNVLKLPKKVIFLILIISSILLFSSKSFMETIALFKFKEEYTMWIGIVFLFTLGLSIIHIFEYFKDMYKNKKTRELELGMIEKFKDDYRNMIKSLDEDELINIREFYVQEKNTIEMIYENSAVAGLVKKRIISFVSKQGWKDVNTNGTVCIFELSSEAKQYFDKFNFEKLNNIPRPNWLNGLENSNRMKQQLLNMQNNLFK